MIRNLALTLIILGKWCLLMLVTILMILGFENMMVGDEYITHHKKK